MAKNTADTLAQPKKPRRLFWFGRKKQKAKAGQAQKKKVQRTIGWIEKLKNVGTGVERELFIENLAMLLHSGMDVLSAMDAIADEVRTKRMKQVVAKVRADVADGATLWRSVESTHILKDYVVSLLRMGEEAGRLVENLRVIVIQQRKERSFKAKLRSAMAYPVLVLSVAFVIGMGLAVYILPRLESVFGSLALDLPILTRFLLDFGGFMRTNGTWVAPLFTAIFLVLMYVVFFARRTRVIGQWILFHLPGIRRLVQEVELARLGYILGTLLEAGLPIVEALRSLHDATVFYAYGNLYERLSEDIELGETFRDGLNSFKRSRRLIPPSIQQIIIAGEQSGRLPEAFKQIGEMYDEKTETTAKNVTTVLEPLLLIVVWIGVAGVALAVIMPIYGLIGGLNDARNNPAASGQVDAVVSPTPSPTPTPTVEAIAADDIQRVRVLSTVEGVLNVRELPSTTAPVTTTVSAGETYAFDDTEEEDGVVIWYHVVVASGVEGADVDEEGWIAAEFVEVLDADGNLVATPTPTPSPTPSPEPEAAAPEDDGQVAGATTVGPVASKGLEVTVEEEAAAEAAYQALLEQAVAEQLQRLADESEGEQVTDQ